MNQAVLQGATGNLTEKTRCNYCGTEVFLPFKCHLCGGLYCAEHRLPESHSCSELWKAKRPRKETVYQREGEIPITDDAYRVSRTVYFFSRTELKHLFLSALLVIGVGISLIFGTRYFSDPILILLFGLIFAFSFFAHEFSHKFLAQKRGLWAEFRMSLFGALITLISIFSPIKLIAPGAVLISGTPDHRTVGRISLSGPLTNMVICSAFLSFASTISSDPNLRGLLWLGGLFNASIALFNLIPFGILDGYKVFMWNKIIWAAAFVLSIALTVFAYVYL